MNSLMVSLSFFSDFCFETKRTPFISSSLESSEFVVFLISATQAVVHCCARV